MVLKSVSYRNVHAAARTGDTEQEGLQVLARPHSVDASFVDAEDELPQCDVRDQRALVPFERLLCHWRTGAPTSVRGWARRQSAFVDEDDGAIFVTRFLKFWPALPGPRCDRRLIPVDWMSIRLLAAEPPSTQLSFHDARDASGSRDARWIRFCISSRAVHDDVRSVEPQLHEAGDLFGVITASVQIFYLGEFVYFCFD